MDSSSNLFLSNCCSGLRWESQSPPSFFQGRPVLCYKPCHAVHLCRLCCSDFLMDDCSQQLLQLVSSSEQRPGQKTQRISCRPLPSQGSLDKSMSTFIKVCSVFSGVGPETSREPFQLVSVSNSTTRTCRGHLVPSSLGTIFLTLLAENGHLLCEDIKPEEGSLLLFAMLGQANTQNP